MSKIMVEMDTEEKTMMVTVDGQEVENVVSVGMSNDEEYSYSHVEITSVEKVGDMHKVTRLMAKESEDAKLAVANGTIVKTKFDDVLVGIQDKIGVEADIENYLLGGKI